MHCSAHLTAGRHRDADSLPGGVVGPAGIRGVQAARSAPSPPPPRGTAVAAAAPAPRRTQTSTRVTREIGAFVKGHVYGVKALITGGAGFIGSHLAERLLAARPRGRRSSTTCQPARSTTSRTSRAHPASRTSSTRSTNESLLAEMIDRSDVVFHLAAAVGVKLIVEQPVHTIETNVHGTEVVLKHANKKKKLVVHRLHVGGLRQEHRRAVPRERRARARRRRRSTAGPTPAASCIDEFLALAYWKERKLPVVIVRLFNTVGPRQTGQYGMVLPTFVRQALGRPTDHGVRRRHASRAASPTSATSSMR